MSDNASMPLYQQVAETLRQRIEHGDYLHNEIPAVRRLAQRMNVSHIVARKAVESLIKDGLLVQHSNGRLMSRALKDDLNTSPAKIAFLAPAFPSGFTTMVRIAVEQVVAECGGLLRPVDYVHWNDSIIEEVLESYDGVVLLASSEVLPASALLNLAGASAKVVTVDKDLTEHGLPCVSLFHPKGISRLVEHLVEYGHKEIDCFNTQPVCEEIGARIAAWREAVVQHGLTGQLINEPVHSYERNITRAYSEMSRLLDEGHRFGSALVFTNEDAAKGAMRALCEHGIHAGEDISICAVGDLCESRYHIPSITCVEMPDAASLLRPVVRWMSSSASRWSGPLFLEQPQISFFAGESTAAPKAARAKRKNKESLQP